MVEVPWFRIGPIYGSSTGADLVYIHPAFLGAAAVWYLPRVAGQDTIVTPALRFVDTLRICTRRLRDETHS